ncbi:MAG: hypothetical protein KC516_01550 [Nanoarchaeota archaeon]|nr:hypothetical protein [Nanoarchaeota archaeon]
MNTLSKLVLLPLIAISSLFGFQNNANAQKIYVEGNSKYCKPCAELEKYLDKKNIEFSESEYFHDYLWKNNRYIPALWIDKNENGKLDEDENYAIGYPNCVSLVEMENGEYSLMNKEEFEDFKETLGKALDNSKGKVIYGNLESRTLNGKTYDVNVRNVTEEQLDNNKSLKKNSGNFFELNYSWNNESITIGVERDSAGFLLYNFYKNDKETGKSSANFDKEVLEDAIKYFSLIANWSYN